MRYRNIMTPRWLTVGLCALLIQVNPMHAISDDTLSSAVTVRTDAIDTPRVETHGSIGTGIPQEVAQDMDVWIALFERMRATLEANDGYLTTSDDVVLMLLFNRTEGKHLLSRKYSATFASSGLDVPDDIFKTLDTKIDALWGEITRLAPSYSLPTGEACDSALMGTLRKKLRGAVADADVLSAALMQDGWTVNRNALGIPSSRSRKGVVLYTVPGEEWYICRQFTVKQPYFAGEASKGVYDVKFGYIRCQSHE